MDDAINGLAMACASTVIGLVFLLAVGAIIVVGWLTVKFCELVLPPLWDALCDGCTYVGRRLAAWWRDVTWKYRVMRAHREAIRQMNAVRIQNVALAHALVQAIETGVPWTADTTAVVRVAVRSAVRQG